MSELEGKLAEYESKKARLEEQVAAASVGREEGTEREQLLHSLKEKTGERQKLTAELEKYKACDPERMKELCKYFYKAYKHKWWLVRGRQMRTHVHLYMQVKSRQLQRRLPIGGQRMYFPSNHGARTDLE